ncbi:MAG: fasciclin domain-containing protein [Planctomycetota bacterium]
MHGCKAICVLLGLSVCSVTEAHRPIFSEQKAKTFEDAIIIADPCVSQVIYRDISEKTPQVWLGFDVEAEFKLFVQIGVPALKRLKGFRPCFLVVGPGLPEVESQIRLPEAVGAKRFCTEEVEKPRFFHEHFTGTDSWILRSETLVLPEKGRYYVVAYDPAESAGKLWLSVGKKEVFNAADIALFPGWKERIRSFHEVQDEKHGVGMELLKTFLGLNAAPAVRKAEKTIVDLIQSETDLSALYSALQTARLLSILEEKGPLTVFAPSDEAFAAVVGLEELLKPENGGRLKALLKAHIVPDRIYLHGRRTNALGGKPVLLQSNGPILVDDALVIKANIIAENGIVHIVDRVIGSDAGIRQIRRMIETSIGYGVPLLNAGRFEACTSAYRTALLNIREFSGEKVSQGIRDSIRAAIEKAEAEKDQSKKAQTLRDALDDIYKQLEAPEKG